MNTEPSTPGRLIRHDREARGLNQRTLAELLGISDGHLRNIENGHRRVTPHRAAQLAALFDVPADRYDPQPPHRGGDEA